MTSSITIAPLNSLVLITGGLTVAVPRDIEPGEGVVSTSSCIAVVCFPEVDGPTNISLGPCPEATSNPAFIGFLDTPSHKVAVWTVEWQKLLEARVPTSRTKIRIWRNHPRWPTEVFIGIGE
jgi:hypothetical protein